MTRSLITTLLLWCLATILYSQNEIPARDTVILGEVVVNANRIPLSLKNNPGSVSLVTPAMLSVMPKTVGAEEALRLVPGVRIDNQHGGERVHLSIRGQGILTERGLRGIGVIIDGIPLNDPSGFAPDLYDVDWATVNSIEVLRGPAAGIYGGSGSGGVLNIYTHSGGTKPFSGGFSQLFGSNGFSKSLLVLRGTNGNIDHGISFSRSGGNGYRDHQAFRSNKFYEKVTFHPSEKLSVTQIISHIDYFHQNPEGLNLGQFDNLAQANPDACPFNEYQKTNRNTIGVHASYNFGNPVDVELTSYLRSWDYKETSNRYAEYRNITNPGAVLQFNLRFGNKVIRNSFSAGTDLKYQSINMYRLESASDPLRVESIDQTNIETDSLLANQIISQYNTGYFALYKMEKGKLTIMGNARYDYLGNELVNKMFAGDTATTVKNFRKISFRVGLSYNIASPLTLFANWGQGFIPPSTEELASNPVGYSGFNTHLVPATSSSADLGIRGFAGDWLYYEITGFLMNTSNDFFRFKQAGRGNQEVFYGNAGNSRRLGVESYLSCRVSDRLTVQAAYTFADYRYTSATIDPVYTDPEYVLTTPPASGQYLPNSPRHQLYAEATYSKGKFEVSMATEHQSKWAIYTDARAYAGELDPTIYSNWQEGFTLVNARSSYKYNLWKLRGEISIFVRNLFNATYMAFTEPDPDGNSYQPGPGREFYGSLTLNF